MKHDMIECHSCGNIVQQHYAVTEGRCWNCNSPLRVQSTLEYTAKALAC